VAHADKAKRKTLAVNDILSACGDMEFDSFIPLLNDALKRNLFIKPFDSRLLKISICNLFQDRKEFLTQNAKAKPAKTAKKTEEVENDGEDVEIEEPEAADAEEESESELAHNESKSNDIENSTDEIRKKKRKLTDSEQVEEETKNEEDNDEIQVDDGSSDDEEEEQL